MNRSAVVAGPEAALACRVVRTPAERAAHAAIRAQVFVQEQHVFTGSDADGRDADPATWHVLGLVGDRPGGTVRLYPLDGSRPGPSWMAGLGGAGLDGDPLRGVWQGDRLAVLPQWRHLGLGVPLVRFAVATAAALGGERMVAMVQVPNVRFFVRLGWVPIGGPCSYVGLPHQRMSITLQ